MTGQHSRYFKRWVAADVMFPVVIVLFSAYFASVYKVPYALVRMLAGLDLFPVAAVLLLSVSYEIDFERTIEDTELDNLSLGAFWLGILYILIYGALKPYALIHEANPENLDLDHYGMAVFTFTFYCVAGGL